MPKYKKRLSKNSNYSSSERFNYLQQLLHEFNITTSKEAKRQVLANIASFAYNPINFNHLRKLNIISTFLNSLKETDHHLKEFSISGLCNLCNDPINMQILCKRDGISKIIECLIENMDNINLIIPTLTILIFFKESSYEISESLSMEINNIMSQLLNTNKDRRIENLVHIYRDINT